MRAPLLIGISGKAEHGKSATARIMVEAADGLDARIFEFSEMLRLSAVRRGLLPADLTRAEMNFDQIKVLVDEGAWGRAQNADYWIRQLFAEIDKSKCEVAICPNIRFPREGETFRGRGGCIVRVNRLNPNGSRFVSLTRDPNEITETALDLWNADYYITNITGHGRLLEEFVHGAFNYIWWRHTGCPAEVPFWGR